MICLSQEPLVDMFVKTKSPLNLVQTEESSLEDYLSIWQKKKMQKGLFVILEHWNVEEWMKLIPPSSHLVSYFCVSLLLCCHTHTSYTHTNTQGFCSLST